MDVNDLKSEMTVLVAKLETTIGMLIADEHMLCRRVGEIVTLKQYVPSHGGDVWFCEHSNGDMAAYCFTELMKVPVAV